MWDIGRRPRNKSHEAGASRLQGFQRPSRFLETWKACRHVATTSFGIFTGLQVRDEQQQDDLAITGYQTSPLIATQSFPSPIKTGEEASLTDLMVLSDSQLFRFAFLVFMVAV
jgi:hypothetical protein